MIHFNIDTEFLNVENSEFHADAEDDDDEHDVNRRVSNNTLSDISQNT